MDSAFRPRPASNWALAAGLGMVLAVALMAVIGPAFAPADPMKETYIGQVGTRFIRPPFPPNSVEGYPLGSDEWGRDLLSRLLWAVRPTLTLVLVVAAVRLVLGIFAGLVSGWSSTWFSRLLDTLISACLAVPVLFVALCVIALMGSEWGVWAFIAGLSLTGWAEPARIVREQTRSLKSQTFVEASRAMGAAPEQLVLGHILPHVLPMMWIQLAFEVAGTLLATAALGFLGYYMNGIWIPIGDWVGQHTTGMPELGEMLGSATTQRVPWSALFAGTVVVLIVLAFNLLGEGLRRQLSPERQRRRADMTRASARAGAWVEDRAYAAAAGILRVASANGVVVMLGVVIIGGVWLISSTQAPAPSQTAVTLPGGNWWATSKRDAQSTYWAAAKGPSQPRILWKFTTQSGFVGGPVVDSRGNLFLSNADGAVYAVSSGGMLLWKKAPAAQPFGSPALSPDGNILVVDVQGGLSALSPQGELLWSVNYTENDQPLSEPVVGASGTAYYATRTRLAAVYPSGKLRFLINLPTYSYVDPMPRLSLDERFLFFEDTVVNAQTGELEFDQTPPPMDSYVVGADGKNYDRLQDGMSEWQLSENGYVLIQSSEFDVRNLGMNFRRPAESGVSPDGNVWLVLSTGFDVPSFVWMEPARSRLQVINFPSVMTRLIGIDALGRVYLCSDMNEGNSFCRAVDGSTAAKAWDFELPEGRGISGGAILPGRMYVAVAQHIFAIGDE